MSVGMDTKMRNMESEKCFLTDLAFALIICFMLLYALSMPVHAAGDLTRIHIGFNQIGIDISINPNLSQTAISKGYKFDNSSSYRKVYGIDGNAITPTRVTLDGVAVKSNSIANDQYSSTDKYTSIKGEMKPDGILTLHITVTDFSTEQGPNAWIDPLQMQVRFIDAEGRVPQAELYYSNNGSRTDPDSPIVKEYIDREQLGWFNAETVSLNVKQKRAEYIITISLNGPVTENTSSNVQTVTQVASKNPGEDGGKVIRPDIIATPKPSGSGKTTNKNDGISTVEKIGISLGGAAATAGALSAASGSKNQNDGDDEAEKKKKTYKMYVFKAFGDAIRKGDEPVKVWARIAEIEKIGNDIRETIRDDLTEKISASGKDMNVRRIGMQNNYMGAEINIPLDSKAETAVLTFTFTGAGIFHNEITFRVIDAPEIIFIDPETQGIYDIKESTEDLLIGDGEGSVLLIGLRNFTEKPDRPDLRGEDVVISCEPVTITSHPDVYTYCITIKNYLQPESPYGIWPLEREILITAGNSKGEKAEGMLSCQLWPEGIFFDTRQLYPKQIRKENDKEVSILVDTSEIYSSVGGVNYMENACMDTGVAYRDHSGLVVVDKPNEPGDRTYFRLLPADDFSEKALDPNNSRIWYDLKFWLKPSYHTDDRLGTLCLDPLMPLTVSNEKSEYHGKFTVFYTKYSQYFEHTVQYAFTGINKEMNDADRETEIKRINRLIDRMRPEDMSRVLQVLRKYGVEAEQDRAHFGTERALSVLEQTEQELRDSLAQIQSLQRLRFMRKMVYEALDIELTHQKIKTDSYAWLWDYYFWCAKSARYFADLSFTVSCYLLFNKYGAAIEPIATPIKDLFLDYVSEVSDLYKWKQGTVQNPIEFFNKDRVKETILDAIENSLLNLIISAAIDQGRGPMTWSEICVCGGTISAFVFAKNISEYTKENPKTGKFETDWWKVFLGTTKDISVDVFKAVVSIVIGRFLNKFLNPYADEDRISIVRNDLAPKLKQAFDYFMDKNPTCGPPPHYWLKFIRYCRLKNVMHSRFSVWYRFHFNGATGSYAFNELAHKQHHECIEYMLLAIAGHSINFAKDLMEDNRNVQTAENKLDSWAKSFDDTVKTITVTNDVGEQETIEVPFMVRVFLFVDYTFEKLGLKEDSLNISGVLPEECPYWSRDKVIEEISKIPGTQQEKDFIENPDPAMKKAAEEDGI